MTEKTIRVKYQIAVRGRLLGSMEIPVSIFNDKEPDEAWSLAAENYIADNHDFLMQPPEIEDDYEFDDVTVAEDKP